MKNIRIPIFFILIALLSCNAEKKQETNPFGGLWSLHIMEQKDSLSGTWKEWRNGMQGYILYDNSDNMALHLTVKGYQDTSIRFPNFTDTISTEALKHLTKSYVYFAKYTVFEATGTIEHARISHSNPGEWNRVVKRRYSFSGDTLILTPVEPSNSGLRLKWIKLP